MTRPLATARRASRTMHDDTYTLPELYEYVKAHADISRDRGLEPTDADHPTDRVWRRRVRGMLQTLRLSGNAERVASSVWVLRGSRERPSQLVLIAPGWRLAHVELLLADA